MVVGAEIARLVEVPLRQLRPVRRVEALGVQLLLPEDLQLLAFRVVFEAGETDERLVLRPRSWLDRLDEVAALADADEFAGAGWDVGCDGHLGYRVGGMSISVNRGSPVTQPRYSGTEVGTEARTTVSLTAVAPRTLAKASKSLNHEPFWLKE